MASTDEARHVDISYIITPEILMPAKPIIYTIAITYYATDYYCHAATCRHCFATISYTDVISYGVTLRYAGYVDSMLMLLLIRDAAATPER